MRKRCRGAGRKRSIECKGIQRTDDGNVFPKVMVFNGAACVFKLLKTSVADVQEEPNSTWYSKCKMQKPSHQGFPCLRIESAHSGSLETVLSSSRHPLLFCGFFLYFYLKSIFFFFLIIYRIYK